MRLGGTELGVWAARFLERSASTLTSLDIRCSVVVSLGGIGCPQYAQAHTIGEEGEGHSFTWV